MHRDNDRSKVFARRAIILGAGKLALVSALVGRMYYLQVLESDRYHTLAEDNRINLRLLAPPRGRIVDRYGQPLAVNQQNYRVVLVAEQVSKRLSDVEEVLDHLGHIIELGEADRRRILRDIRRKRRFMPVTIRENLEWEDVVRIEVNAPDLPGVMIDVGQSRSYPLPETTSHILGYVAPVADRDLTGDPLLELPGFRIGKAGVERIYDLQLRGTGGNSQVEVNAFGRVIRELDRNEGQPGAEVVLTIDLELQNYVSQRLTGESAAAVVIDVRNGEILALASTPGFDPNAFNRGLTQDEWAHLSGNPMTPLINKAVGGQYPPGSTFKPMVALTALERGIITPKTRFSCGGHVTLGNASFHCWKRGGHGSLDVTGGIMHSCDVFFYEVAKRTNIDRIAEVAERFGFGSRTGIDLSGEQPGIMPTRVWKQKALNQTWQKGETLHAAIGQGYVLSTPLQLAVMTARLVNGGYKVIPHIAKDVVSAKGVAPRPRGEPENLGFNPQNIKIIVDAMCDVVNHPNGTARRARITEPGFEMGGKTGTSQVRRISKSERDSGVKKNEDLPWAQRDHALFVGFAPTSGPKYAVAVLVEHGGGGSAVAAPIARDILLRTQLRDTTPPAGLPQAGGEEARRRG